MKFIATILLMLCAISVNAQKQKFKGKPKTLPKDTIKFVVPEVVEQVDSSLLQNPDEIGVEVAPAMEGDYITEEMDMPMAIEAAPAEEPAYGYNRYGSRLKHKDLKLEENPDVKAHYREGVDSMFRDVFNHLRVPYTYSGNDYYVLLQVTVGKDSVLYNPVILYSPGAEYTANAQRVAELMQGKFSPAMKNGMPVNSTIIIPVRFSYVKNHYPGRYH